MTLQPEPTSTPVRLEALRVITKIVKLLEPLTDHERAFVWRTVNELLVLSTRNVAPQEKP